MLELEQLHKAHVDYMEAGFHWQAKSIQYLQKTTQERYPSVRTLKVLVILGEDYTEHTIEAFDDEGRAVPDAFDDIDEELLLATEGAVFSEGEHVTIYVHEEKGT